jgi:hypothetical protein
MLGVAETYSDGEFGPPKTRSSRRTIPISSSLIEIFKRLRPLSCEPETLVFMTAKATPLNCKNLYNRELAPASDAIGLPRASWQVAGVSRLGELAPASEATSKELMNRYQ